MGNNEIIKIFVVWLAISSVLLSCSNKSTVYDRLDRQMKNVTEGNSMIVSLSDLFPMQWDTMYVLQPGAHEKTLKYQIGQDIERKIVFVNHGEVVYSEWEIAVENPYKVVFYSNQPYYIPSTASFSVQKRYHYKTKRYYLLMPSEETPNQH